MLSHESAISGVDQGLLGLGVDSDLMRAEVNQVWGGVEQIRPKHRRILLGTGQFRAIPTDPADCAALSAKPGFGMIHFRTGHHPSQQLARPPSLVVVSRRPSHPTFSAEHHPRPRSRLSGPNHTCAAMRVASSLAMAASNPGGENRDQDLMVVVVEIQRMLEASGYRPLAVTDIGKAHLSRMPVLL